MNDLIEGARVEGSMAYHGVDLYGRDVDPVEVRRRSGWCSRNRIRFPKTIYDNIAFGPLISGVKKKWHSTTSWNAPCRAAIWEEVKDRLKRVGWACPAASSNVYASPAPSQSSPK